MKTQKIISLIAAFLISATLFSCKNGKNPDETDTSAVTETADTADTSADTSPKDSDTATDASATETQSEQQTEAPGNDAPAPSDPVSGGGSGSGGASAGSSGSVSGGGSMSSGGAGGVVSGGGNNNSQSSGSGNSGSGSGGASSGGNTSGGSSSSGNNGGTPTGGSTGDRFPYVDPSKYFGIRCDTSPDYPVPGEDTSKTVTAEPIKGNKPTDPRAEYNSHRVAWDTLKPGTEINGVTVGHNGWMFYEDTLNDYIGTSRYTQVRAEGIVKMMKERVSYLENTLGMKVYMLIPPNKNTIYPEYMPETYTMGGYRKIDQVVDLLRDEVGMNIIDVRDALYEAKFATPGRSLYYQTDTHWNNHAGFIAYTELMKAIKKDFPNAVYYSKNEYQIDYFQTYAKDQLYYLGYYDDFKSYGPQYTLRNPCSTSFWAQAYQPGGQWQFANKYSDGYADYYRFYTYTNYTNASAPSVYMIRDSFSVAMARFMKDSFSKCTMDWTFSCYKEHIRNIGADIVVFEVAERNIDNFLNTTPFRSGDPY